MKPESKSEIDEKRMADWEYVAQICSGGSLYKLQETMQRSMRDTKDDNLKKKLFGDINFIEEIVKFKKRPKTKYGKLVVKLCNFTNDWQDGKGSAPSFKDADVMLTDAILAIRELEKETEELKKNNANQFQKLLDYIDSELVTGCNQLGIMGEGMGHQIIEFFKTNVEKFMDMEK